MYIWDPFLSQWNTVSEKLNIDWLLGIVINGTVIIILNFWSMENLILTMLIFLILGKV